MSNAHKGHSARRVDPTRTAQAKAATLSAKQARAIKHSARPLDVDALALELRSVEVAR